jgi:integrase
MPQVKLTPTFVKKTLCSNDKLKVDYFDTDTIGLMLEIRSSGNKTFYYRYTKESKTHLKKIGCASTITLEDARRVLLKLKKNSANDEVSLLTPKQHRIITLRKFYENNYIPYVKHYSKSWDKNASTFLNHILPDIGDLYMDKITPPMIVKFHTAMVEKKKLSNSSANKYVVFLRHAYNLAIEWKIKGVTENPATKVKMYEERHRERFITPIEAKRLMFEVKQSNNPHLKYIIPYLILTGARRSEVLRAEWVDVDFTHRVWTIPITKNKKIRKIPISDELLELLQTIPKESKYLFPHNSKVGYYTNLFRTWDKARCAAGLSDVRLHDLRHSFASMLVNSGRSLYEVQRLLGHSSIKMTQRYAHLSEESLHLAVSCAGKLLQ